MKIPDSKRKKALIIVDVQPAFLNERNRYIIDHIIKLIKLVPYDLYLDAVFYAEAGSIRDIQRKYILPKDDNIKTEKTISDTLKTLNSIKLEKTTSSIFKADKSTEKTLKENGIEEIHLVGLDTNDCVLASAFEAFDLGFITYVIEECCQSSSSDQLHNYGLEILRKQRMTNNYVKEPIDFIEI